MKFNKNSKNQLKMNCSETDTEKSSALQVSEKTVQIIDLITLLKL